MNVQTLKHTHHRLVEIRDIMRCCMVTALVQPECITATHCIKKGYTLSYSSEHGDLYTMHCAYILHAAYNNLFHSDTYCVSCLHTRTVI